MIAFTSMILAQAAAAATPAPVTPTADAYRIEWIESRLQGISASVAQTSSGGWQCALSGSTGVAYVDDRLCQVTAQCSLRHGFDSSALNECLGEERRDLVKDYRKRIRRGR